MAAFFIDENFTFQSRTIACHHVPQESHTAVFVLNQFELVLSGLDLELKPNQVATTDRGSNMTGQLGICTKCTRNDCACHLISTMVTRVVFKSDRVVEGKKVHDYRYREISDLKEIFDMFDASFKLVESFNRTGYVKFSQYAFSVSLINLNCYSMNAKLSKSLKKAMEVRWNSIFYMLSSIHEMYDEVVSLCSRSNKLNLMRNIGKDLLKEVIDVLRAFEDATLSLEKYKVPTIHQVIYHRHKLIQHLEDQNAGTRLSIKSFKDVLRQELDAKFSLSPLHVAASLLDPMQKNILHTILGIPNDDITKATDLIKQIVKRKFEPQQNVSNSTASTSQNSTESVKRIRFSDLHQLLNNEEIDLSVDQKFQEEWTSYLNYRPVFTDPENFDRLEFWRSMKVQYRMLAYAARCVLAVPASASKCECDFSIAGRLKSKTRASLSPKNLDALLTIRANVDLLQ